MVVVAAAANDNDNVGHNSLQYKASLYNISNLIINEDNRS